MFVFPSSKFRRFHQCFRDGHPSRIKISFVEALNSTVYHVSWAVDCSNHWRNVETSQKLLLCSSGVDNVDVGTGCQKICGWNSQLRIIRVATSTWRKWLAMLITICDSSRDLHKTCKEVLNMNQINQLYEVDTAKPRYNDPGYNNIPLITIIVRFCGPKVRIYNQYKGGNVGNLA